MRRLYKIFKYYKIYKKNLLSAEQYLKDKYGFEINNWNEFYTTISFIDMPEDLEKKLGREALIEIELKKFLNSLNQDLEKLDLDELVKRYDFVKLNNYEFGIAFGYSLANSKTLTIISTIFKLVIIISIMTGIYHLVK